jgi:hypothetical protein
MRTVFRLPPFERAANYDAENAFIDRFEILFKTDVLQFHSETHFSHFVSGLNDRQFKLKYASSFAFPRRFGFEGWLALSLKEEHSYDCEVFFTLNITRRVTARLKDTATPPASRKKTTNTIPVSLYPRAAAIDWPNELGLSLIRSTKRRRRQGILMP